MPRNAPSQLELLGLQTTVAGFEMAINCLQDQLRQMKQALGTALTSTHQEVEAEAADANADLPVEEVRRLKQNKYQRDYAARKAAAAEAAKKTVQKSAKKKNEFVKKSRSVKDYWASMTPEERSKEMSRRMKVAEAKKAAAALAAASANKKSGHAMKEGAHAA